MKKKMLLLLSLLGVCAAAGIALIFLLKPADTDYSDLYDSEDIHDEHFEGDNFIENTSEEYLISKDADSIDHMVLTNKNGTFTILRNEKAGTLTIKEMKNNVPVCDSYLEYVWYYGEHLGYSYKIIDTDDYPLSFSDYSLDAPQAAAEVFYTDGSTARFEIGAELPSEEDVYYFRFGDEQCIYITEFNLAMFQGESYFIDTDVFSINSDDSDTVIGKMVITGSEIPEKITIEPYNTQDRSDQSYGASYIMSSPVKAAIDKENVTALVNELTYFQPYLAVCSTPDKATLKSYGLDKPKKIIRFFRNGTEETISIGNTVGELCYLTVDGIDAIYSMETVNAESLLGVCVDYCRSATIRAYTIDALKGVTVTFNDTDYVFTATRTPLDEEETYYEYHAFNEKGELNINSYKNFLSVLSDNSAISWETDAAAKEPALTIKAEYFDGFGRKPETISFFNAGSNRFLCTIDGKPQGKVSHVWLARLMKATLSLSRNESVSA